MSVKTTVRRAICIVCLALVAGLVFALPAYAEKGDPYEYTVRVFGGNYGTYNGENPYVTTVKSGEFFVLSAKSVTLEKGSKYFVKGFRVSGEDELCSEAYTVTEDTDFVVAYGALGDTVSYTVSFVEKDTGKELKADNGSSSATFSGKVGDKPVVPFEYITGYSPQFRNITETLGKQGAGEWKLEYVKIADSSSSSSSSTTGTGTAARTSSTRNTSSSGSSSSSAAASSAAASSKSDNDANASGQSASTQAASGQSADKKDDSHPTTLPTTQQIGDADKTVAGDAESIGDGTAESDVDSTSSKAMQPRSEPADGSGIPIGVIYGAAALIVAGVAAGAVALRRHRD